MVDPSTASLARTWEPPRPDLVAILLTGLGVAALCAPMLGGQFLVGPQSDQFIAGYGFRQFWTEYVRAHGSVPLWNPYIFGGLPYVGAMHGDLLYPFTWIRLLVPTDTAMNLAFFVHLWLAGALTYGFLRAMRLPWTAAVTGGVAFQLTGIVASLVHPGHDGKLYVSALLPLVLWSLVRWIRDGRVPALGVLGLAVGCAILSPSFQMAYYLLLAAGLFTVYLAFFDPDGPPRSAAWPRVSLALGAVLLGAGVAAVQLLPFLDYLPFSPRSVPGTSTGWEYATSYSLPLEELVDVILPAFSAGPDHYWGQNQIKFHGEYLGVATLILAAIGLTRTSRPRLRWALAVIAGFFLLVSLGGHTPFYRLVYELLPMMKKVRAPGMAFTFVAFPVAVWAALGVEALIGGAGKTPVNLLGWLAAVGVLLLLSVTGVFTNIARGLARPEALELLAGHHRSMTFDALRVAVFGLATVGLILAWQRGRLAPRWFALALVGIVGIDLGVVNRRFFRFSPPARELYAPDAITTRIGEAPKPTRVLDLPAGPGYGWSILMGYDIPQALGYHGNEIRYYDDLLGGKNVWQFKYSPQIWKLLAIRFIIVADTVRIPGYHHVLGPVTTAQGRIAHLYEADTVPPYAQVAVAALRAPAAAIVPTLLDPRLPGFDRVVLYDSSQAVDPPPLAGLPGPSPVHARVTAWEPGRMRIALSASLADPSYLLVSENWYPGWQARVDGRPVTPLRGNQSLLTVPLPPGAETVELAFTSPPYARGRVVSWLAVALLGAVIGLPVVRKRRPQREAPRG